MKVINLYGGPGTGKSTTAAGVFAELKLLGVNAEYVQEYAKDKAWEFGNDQPRTPKVFQAQEYIFAKQHFRMRRCSADVDVLVTDCPLFLGLVYMPEDFPLPSMRKVIREAYDLYDNMDVFLVRNKPYNPKGRFQTEEAAKDLDGRISQCLRDQNVEYVTVYSGRPAVERIIHEVRARWPHVFPRGE